NGTLGGSVGGDGAGSNGFTFGTNRTAVIGQETVTYTVSADGRTRTPKIPASPDASRLNSTLFTVAITDKATGSYTVTLLDNVLHAQGPNDENQTDPQATINYVITDADGSTAASASTLTITFDDDAPTATSEASQDVPEGAEATGQLDFVGGADGATVTHIGATALVFGADGYSQAIDIGNGMLQVKADGSYSFTADASVVGPGTASATFTVTDGDGDTA